jgi:prepilin-type N-terminal cleavage/methylation domain-containing protein
MMRLASACPTATGAMTPAARSAKCAAFSLIELLVVVGLIILLVGGFAVALSGRSGEGAALTNAQSMLNGMIHAARAQSALQQANTRLIVYGQMPPSANADANKYLRALQVVRADTTPTGTTVWVAVGDPVMLPAPVCVVPPSPVPTNHLSLPAGQNWNNNVATGPVSTLTVLTRFDAHGVERLQLHRSDARARSSGDAAILRRARPERARALHRVRPGRHGGFAARFDPHQNRARHGRAWRKRAATFQQRFRRARAVHSQNRSRVARKSTETPWIETAGAQTCCARHTLRVHERARQDRAPTVLDCRAFSLLEVVAAVAIFSLGMLAVLGLFAPVTKSVVNVADSESAAKVADAVRARLQAMPFDTALTLVQSPADVRKNDGDGNYNPNDGTKHPAVLFGKLSGEVGIYDAATGRKAWYDSQNVRVNDADKFFEIDLVRNEAISPPADDPATPMVAYNIRVRWPAFVAASSGNPVQVGANPAGGGSVPFDHSKKQVIFFTGSIVR